MPLTSAQAGLHLAVNVLLSNGSIVQWACPRDAPEPPSTANGHHEQQPVNKKLERALNPGPTHRTRS
jgi:hypothetical protein